MQKITERLTTTSAWAASSTLAGVDLPRTGFITELRIRAKITATLTATANPDGPRRVLDGLQIAGDNRTFLGLTGNINLGTLLALMNLADYGVSGLHANLDVDATSFDQSYVFHPGSYPRNRFDTSVVIPARALAQLQVKVNAPAATVVDANGEITAGTYYYEVDVVKDLPITKNTMMPAGYPMVWSNDANYPAFGKEIDVPAGGYLRRIVIMALDDTATAPLRKDDQITGVKLYMPKSSKVVIESNWEELKAATARRYGIVGDAEPVALGAIDTTRPGYNGAMHLPAGFVIIDLRDYVDASENPLGPVYGLNLIGGNGYTPQTGDFKLGLTIENQTPGDKTIIFWDIVVPVDPTWIGK